MSPAAGAGSCPRKPCARQTAARGPAGRGAHKRAPTRVRADVEALRCRAGEPARAGNGRRACPADWRNDPAVSAQLKPLKHTPRRGSSCRAPVWSAVVVGLDPVADHTHGVALVLEAVPVDALLFQRPDQTLDHPVLLRSVRGDELLLQVIAAHQARVDAAGKNQTVVRAQQERLRHPRQYAAAGDQGLFQRRSRRRRLAVARQLPAPGSAPRPDNFFNIAVARMVRSPRLTPGRRQ